jgi:hypothetical protein
MAKEPPLARGDWVEMKVKGWYSTGDGTKDGLLVNSVNPRSFTLFCTLWTLRTVLRKFRIIPQHI